LGRAARAAGCCADCGASSAQAGRPLAPKSAAAPTLRLLHPAVNPRLASIRHPLPLGTFEVRNTSTFRLLNFQTEHFRVNELCCIGRNRLGVFFR
jgi:hypothetical protein